MKKILYVLCAMLTFASCTKEELPTTDGQNPDGTYTFNIGIENPDYAPQTRATVAMGRYVMELYEGDLTSTPEKMTNTTGVFTVEMKKNTDYVCLFWADNGTTYNVENLQAVTQADETELGTAAYFANIQINTTTFNGAITLKRAVAELSFIDKGGLHRTKNTLKITYPYASATFNLGDGTVAHASGSAVRTIANIARPLNKTTAFASDFILAPTAAGSFAGLKVQLNTEVEKTVAATAIQANFRTKITGEYQPKPTPAAVGDFYMRDGFWLPAATTLTTEEKANCIGIVYEVNPNGISGKIVGLDEKKTVWSTEEINTGAVSDTNGADNMSTVFALSSYITDKNTYQAFAWCAAKNPSAPSGIKWYIPAKNELEALYKTKAAVNTSLSKATGAAQLYNGWHWSSTQVDASFAWSVNFYDATTSSINKNNGNPSVRVVSAF